MLDSRQKIKQLIANFIHSGGFAQKYLYYKNRHKAMILAYHRVIPKEKLESFSQMEGMYVSVESLEMHLEYLKNIFNIVPLKKIIDDISAGEQWEKPLCAITFDDGWKDNYEYAFPVLKKLEIPATIFIVGSEYKKFNPICWYVIFETIVHSNNANENLTQDPVIDNFLKKTMTLRPIERARQLINIMRKLPQEKFIMVYKNIEKHFYENSDLESFRIKYNTLSHKDIQDMSRYGIEFGYHSFNHFMLTKISEKQLEEELVVPENITKDKSINFQPIFCYPDGKYNDKIINTLKTYNYTGAVSLGRGVNDIQTDCFKLKRINIHEGIAESLPLFSMHLLNN